MRIGGLPPVVILAAPFHVNVSMKHWWTVEHEPMCRFALSAWLRNPDALFWRKGIVASLMECVAWSYGWMRVSRVACAVALPTFKTRIWFMETAGSGVHTASSSHVFPSTKRS